MKKIGLVGLPNSGKSSIFKLLTKKKNTLVANYCFSTMDKETENFKLWDERVAKISSFFKNPKLTFSELKISDIPGIVKDAHKNKGLGSRFISHIRECDMILLLLRFFEDENIIHFDGSTDPLRDFDLLNSELILSDIEQIERIIEKFSFRDRKEVEEKEILIKIKSGLENFEHISKMNWLKEEDKKKIRNYGFLTNKRILLVANCGKPDKKQEEKILLFKKKFKDHKLIEIDIKNEIENLESKNFEEFFKNKEFFDSIKNLLELKNFFTAGEKEVKSWTIKSDSDAKECAGLIHSDIKDRLIRVNFVNEIYCESLEDIKKKQKKEKKDYLIKDGDICDFIFN